MDRTASNTADQAQEFQAKSPVGLRPSLDLQIHQAAVAASAQIAPLWPLQHFVAVNPMLGLAEHSFTESGRLLARAAGARLTMPRAYYRDVLANGGIGDEDLAEAIAELHGELPGPLSPRQVRAEAFKPETDPASLRLPSLASVAAELTGTDWETLIVGSVSGWAGDYFDRGIAAWTSPLRKLDPWPAYRAQACVDRSAELLGLPEARGRFAELPQDPEALLKELVTTLKIPGEGLQSYFHRLLADVAGWAGYARYLGWGAELRGESRSAARQLLAIRAAWELVIFRGLDSAQLRSRWSACADSLAADDSAQWRSQRAVDHVLHLAFERAIQRRFAGRIQRSASEPPNAEKEQERASVQAVFCIDVRSERLRRALEQVSPQAETLGFAGFFGLPAAHQDETGHGTARCPVLLEPAFTVHESTAGRRGLGRREQQGLTARWSQFRRSAIATFGYVESMGLLYAAKLLRAAWGRFSAEVGQAPAVSTDSRLRFDLGLRERIDLAEGILRGMSLTDHFAPLVLFVGHGSTSANNPYASALDCGACGGHAGDMNARLAAALLNDRFIRAGLLERGIDLPDDAVFVAALHNTTTDEVDLAAPEDLPAGHAQRFAALQSDLARAGARVRAERAPTLGLTAAAARSGRLVSRATDWSQVRPEWGLAGCAAFIAAPRNRTRAAQLDGRSFLHTYDWRSDSNFKVLETIMTAPLVVASWITLQYYASTVDNRRFGSGDKTLHNVVGGLGVLEGAGGDLRTGLPMQSIHNGRSLVHEPVRLMAVIEAPRAALSEIIDRHDSLRQLLDNEWVQLHAMDDQGQLWRRSGAGDQWVPLSDLTSSTDLQETKAA
jgi:uncharacterized protein YbcC (UPF0753/DUF2309 family)